jgi:ABC-2 type transport system ATP-binding protein
MTVGGYISYLRPFYPDWDQTLESEVLRRLRLPLERRIKNLSHGTRLKMALACALPFRPKLLIMDEPLSGLDPLMREEVMQSLLRWTGEATVLMSSHELVEVEEFATHVAFLDRGKLLLQEAAHDLVKRFREVRATFAYPVILSADVPGQWLELRVQGHVLSFIETRYSDEENLASKLGRVVGTVSELDIRQMGLRSIFTALARTIRTEES